MTYRNIRDKNQLWVNPDYGLKTHHWDENKKALIEMENAAKKMRVAVEENVAV